MPLSHIHVHTQLSTKVPEGKTEECGRIGHSIKGAAANLMCYKLRDAALAMERVGLAAAHKTKPADQLATELAATLTGVCPSALLCSADIGII